MLTKKRRLYAPSLINVQFVVFIIYPHNYTPSYKTKSIGSDSFLKCSRLLNYIISQANNKFIYYSSCCWLIIDTKESKYDICFNCLHYRNVALDKQVDTVELMDNNTDMVPPYGVIDDYYMPVVAPLG